MSNKVNRKIMQEGKLTEGMDNGVEKRITPVGRIVIPPEVKQVLKLAENDYLEINVEAGRIVLTRYEPAECFFCGGDEALVRFRGRAVCRSCAMAADVAVNSR